jgi:hypothetical protein
VADQFDPETPKHLVSLTWYVDLLERQKRLFDDRNAMLVELRKMRFMETKPIIPPAYSQLMAGMEVRTGLAAKWVQTQVGSLTVHPFTVHAPLRPRPTQLERERGSRRERFCPAMWKALEAQSKADIFRRLVDAQVADGGGVLKGVYRPKAWQGMPALRDYFKEHGWPDGMPTEEIQASLQTKELNAYNRYVDKFIRGKPLPFAIRNVDLATFYPVQGDFGFDAVLEVSERPLLQVRRMAGVFGGQAAFFDDRDLGPTVEIMEYWDPEWFALVAKGSGDWNLIGTMRHGHRRIPYWYMPGEETSSTRPEYGSMSALFKLRHTVPAIDQALTMWLSRMLLTAYPSFTKEGYPPSAVDGQEQPQEEVFDPGAINYHDPGTQPMQPLRLDQFSGDLENILGVLLGLSSDTQINDAAAGGDRLSGESGSLRSVLVDLARTGYHQIPAHAERELGDFFGWIMVMIEQEVKRPVWVREDNDSGRRSWESLAPTHIDGDYDLDVRIKPFNPVMDIALGQYARNMVASRMLPKRWALENIMGLEQPEDLLDELLSDEIMENPEIRSALVHRAAVRSGLVPLASPAGPPTNGAMGLNRAEAGTMGGRPLAAPAVEGAENLPGAGPGP